MTSWRTCHFVVLDVVPELEVRFVPRLLTQVRCTSDEMNRAISLSKTLYIRWNEPCHIFVQNTKTCRFSAVLQLRVHWILNPACYGTADHISFCILLFRRQLCCCCGRMGIIWRHMGATWIFNKLSVSPWESIVHSRTWRPIHLKEIYNKKYIWRKHIVPHGKNEKKNENK